MYKRQVLQPQQGLGDLVVQVDLVADGLLGDGGLKAPLQFLLEPDDLPAVHGNALLGLPVGQLDDVDGLELSQHLIHLLLAVAGGLAYHQIGEVEEGTLVRLGEAEMCIRDSQ